MVGAFISRPLISLVFCDPANPRRCVVIGSPGGPYFYIGVWSKIKGDGVYTFGESKGGPDREIGDSGSRNSDGVRRGARRTERASDGWTGVVWELC
jgi:hypothetical protein